MSQLPVFPAPTPWFKWSQRYIYEAQVESGGGPTSRLVFMDGYGGSKPDRILKGGQGGYRYWPWLSSVEPMALESATLIRIEVGRSAFGEETMRWLAKGTGSIVLDGELEVFRYPLRLGASWTSRTTFRRIFPVTLEGEVVAFIPPGTKGVGDLLVAPGRRYRLPIEPAQIPSPLAELSTSAWDELVQAAGTPSATTSWKSVSVPAGPRAGERVPGYFAIRTTTRMAGIPIIRQEIWKDVRGAVPLYRTITGFPLVLSPKQELKLARAWSGVRFLKE